MVIATKVNPVIVMINDYDNTVRTRGIRGPEKKIGKSKSCWKPQKIKN
jgi:hypothetical protein